MVGWRAILCWFQVHHWEPIVTVAHVYVDKCKRCGHVRVDLGGWPL